MVSKERLIYFFFLIQGKIFQVYKNKNQYAFYKKIFSSCYMCSVCSLKRHCFFCQSHHEPSRAIFSPEKCFSFGLSTKIHHALFLDKEWQRNIGNYATSTHFFFFHVQFLKPNYPEMYLTTTNFTTYNSSTIQTIRLPIKWHRKVM